MRHRSTPERLTPAEKAICGLWDVIHDQLDSNPLWMPGSYLTDQTAKTAANAAVIKRDRIESGLVR